MSVEQDQLPLKGRMFADNQPVRRSISENEFQEALKIPAPEKIQRQRSHLSGVKESDESFMTCKDSFRESRRLSKKLMPS